MAPRVLRSHSPGTTCDHARVSGCASRIAVVAAADAGQQPHPFQKRNAICAFLDALPVREYLVEPVSIDLNPFAFEQNETFLRGHQLAALGGREPFALQGDLDRKIHQALQAKEAARFFADPDIDLWTRWPSAFPPIGHPHQQAALLEHRDFTQKPMRIVRASRPSVERGGGSLPARAPGRFSPQRVGLAQAGC